MFANILVVIMVIISVGGVGVGIWMEHGNRDEETEEAGEIKNNKK